MYPRLHLYLDPEPPAGPGAGNDPKPEGKPKTESTPEADDSKLLKFPTSSGENIEITPQQFLTLAQLGYDSIQKKKEEPKEEDKDETLEDKYEKLNAEFLAFKNSTEQEKKLASTRSLMDQEVSKLEIIKEMPELADGVKLQALAIQSLDPKYTIEQAIKIVAVERQKMYENIIKKTGVNASRLKNAMGGTIRGTGTVPVIDKEKKFGPKDVTDGTSMKLMSELLESMTGE